MDTAGFDVPNSRAIVKQLLTLSQDPDNQPFIVQERGCLAGLVQYVLHEDLDVVLMATRALQFLSSHPENKSTMREFLDLVDNLNEARSRSFEHPRVGEFIGGIFANLNLTMPENAALDSDYKNDENVSMLGNSQMSMGLATKKHVGERKYKTITFYVDDIDVNSVRDDVEMVVIKVPGVVSVTVAPEKRHLKVGSTDDEKEIVRLVVRALAARQFSAKPVISSSQRNEIEEEDGDYPEYLEEEDYDDESSENNCRIARQGFSSLEARLEQQQRQEEAKKLEKSSRLISKMSCALSDASSWLMGY